MKLLTKLKKVKLFIMLQSKKIVETVFSQYLYDDKKSYFNGDFHLFFEYLYYNIENYILIKQLSKIKFINLF